MNENEWRKFVMQGTRTGKLATVQDDGQPHVVPIWFILDGRDWLFMTGENTVKAGNIRRDPRVAINVDDGTFPYSFVTVEGEASILNPAPDKFLEIATNIAGRYVGAERAAEYGRRNAVPGELLIRVKPTKILSGVDTAL
ncbi:MAG: PPOX class F420-dependent oxidoreductase [Anaerolineales bacterium]